MTKQAWQEALAAVWRNTRIEVRHEHITQGTRIQVCTWTNTEETDRAVLSVVKRHNVQVLKERSL